MGNRKRSTLRRRIRKAGGLAIGVASLGSSVSVVTVVGAETSSSSVSQQSRAHHDVSAAATSTTAARPKMNIPPPPPPPPGQIPINVLHKPSNSNLSSLPLNSIQSTPPPPRRETKATGTSESYSHHAETPSSEKVPPPPPPRKAEEPVLNIRTSNDRITKSSAYFRLQQNHHRQQQQHLMGSERPQPYADGSSTGAFAQSQGYENDKNSSILTGESSYDRNERESHTTNTSGGKIDLVKDGIGGTDRSLLGRHTMKEEEVDGNDTLSSSGAAISSKQKELSTEDSEDAKVLSSLSSGSSPPPSKFNNLDERLASFMTQQRQTSMASLSPRNPEKTINLQSQEAISQGSQKPEPSCQQDHGQGQRRPDHAPIVSPSQSSSQLLQQSSPVQQQPQQGPQQQRQPQQNPLPPGARYSGYNQRTTPVNHNNPQRPHAPTTYSGGRRAVPNYRPSQTRTGTSSTFKSLWRKVESGLDSLASFEDKVAGQASRLVSSSSSSSSGSSNNRKQPTSRPVPTEPVRDARAETRAHFGQKYKNAKIESQAKESTSNIQAAVPAVATRQINWGDKSSGSKVIQTNGGASEPGSNNNGPTIPAAYSTNQPIPPGQPTRPLPPGPNPNGNSTPNLYMQQKRQAPPNRPEAGAQAAVARQERRDSRIPWNTGAAADQGRPRPVERQPSRAQDSDDIDPKPSWSEKLGSFVPRFPSLSLKNPFKKNHSPGYASLDAWQAEEDEEQAPRGFLGIFGSGKKNSSAGSSSTWKAKSPEDTKVLAAPLQNMLERCQVGRKNALTTDADVRQFRSIARTKATFDVAVIAFVVLGLQEIAQSMMIPMRMSLEGFLADTLPNLGSVFVKSLSSWAPILFAFAYLTNATSGIVLDPKLNAVSTSVESDVLEEAKYCQLYLRLASSTPVNSKIPEQLVQAAHAQGLSLVSRARLRCFAAYVVAFLFYFSVPNAKAAMMTTVSVLTESLLLKEWRTWPLPWDALKTSLVHLFSSYADAMHSLLVRGTNEFLSNPLSFAFHVSIFVSLLALSYLPRIENQRSVEQIEEDEEEVGQTVQEATSELAKLGASSASRLSLLSENGSVESVLERWRQTSISMSEDEPNDLPLSFLVRKVAYLSLGALMTLGPFAVSYFVGASAADKYRLQPSLEWDSLISVAVVLVFGFTLAKDAVGHVIEYSSLRPIVNLFSQQLKLVTDEIRSRNSRQADIQFTASVSPTAGIAVKDLWAAHTTKRAWAVRGANLECKNGEVLVVLGDDGSGKSRLLTSLAESMVAPPKRALSANQVRGTVSVGGVDVSKWDRSLLKRRLGLWLTDVRTVADMANTVSGNSLEEILEPIDGLASIGPSHKITSSEKAAILLGLKITGLYSTLLPKLPSKLSTIITANEEDLKPSLLGSQSCVLSPAEWSKLLIARILAQAVYDNDNSAASADRVENSLMGSVLVLDEPAALLSEVEEAKFLKELRKTSAATIITSNKWATGRLGDRIVVLKDGAIVESGTHNELLARGPQGSLYAAKWHEMTMQ